jgi:GPH family glycoside/pentoside/hexuronide:cation symporter
MSGLQVLPYAIAAEITDHDAQITGQRRQGIYYAGWGVFDQLASGAASALLPLFLLMGSSHSQPQGPLGIRLLGVVAGVLMLAGFLIFLRYPLAQGTS